MKDKTTQIIAISNQKGGVAKTTTTAYLGTALARLNRNVLLIDSDPQGSLTFSLELNEEQQEFALDNNLAAVYESGHSVESCRISIRDNLDLLATSPDLVMTEVALESDPESISTEPERLLQIALGPIANQYDYILIDCPPSQGMLTLNALVAAKWVVVPTMASVISLTGLERMIEQIHEIVHGEPPLNEDLELLGVLITRFRKDRTVEVDIETRLRSVPEEFTVFNTVIPDRGQFELLGELQSQTGRHLLDLSMVSYSLLPYMTFAMELEKVLAPKTSSRKK